MVTRLWEEGVLLTEETSHRLDRLALHPRWGLILFVGVVYLFLQAVFAIGGPLAILLEHLFAHLASLVSAVWPWGTSSLSHAAVTSAIAGVGGVLAYTPNLFVLFLGMAFLEQSGYLSRGSLLLDRFMGRVGLSGACFIPLALGFGCSVPAVMAARLIKDRRERITTVLVLPFLSCSGRLPVYLLIVSAFFPFRWQATAMFAVYLLGILTAALMARILRRTVLVGEGCRCPSDMPPYQIPSFRDLLRSTWERGRHFLQKAGTTILIASIVLGLLSAWPHTEGTLDEQARHALLGRMGSALEPIFLPMGGDWRVADAALASLASKEMFVSQSAILFRHEGTGVIGSGLSQKLRETYPPAAALAFLVFILFSAPCIATFATVRAETGSWKWATAQYLGMTLLAYGAAVVVYQVARLVAG